MEPLPHNPGCYLFQDMQGNIIYIGKAKDLRKRVASYFSKKNHDPKTQALVASIADIDFIVTTNEVEALILENNLIKKHQPKYNIDLKDSKRYAFIQITDEEFPRLIVARKRDSARCFGPFVSAEERDDMLNLMRRMFLIRTCTRMPKRPCLRYHIRLCGAPCTEKVTKEEYLVQVRNASQVLSGHSADLIADLTRQMSAAAAKHEYERALQLRNQISAVSYLKERQNMERHIRYDEDIINFVVVENTVYLMIFNIYKGTLASKEEFIFPETPEFLSEFITQYYAENPVPKELIVPTSLDPAVPRYLEKLRGSRVRCIVPKAGEKLQLLELVKKNIEISHFGDSAKVNELGQRLRMQTAPNVIECFDISHLSGTLTVGSMVQFRNGKPDKSNYRRFKIRTVQGGDDFAAMAEVIHRRYMRLVAEKSALPDLIIIDGGRGQLSRTLSELDTLGLKIPTLAIAKRFEELYLPGLTFPLRLNTKDRALLFLQEMRDEAHRFALKYNRLLRKKKLALDRTP
jgi:excinuclease ABC subunit C